MKAIFVIAFVFACMFCEITSLECYRCAAEEVKAEVSSFENYQNCASPELVNCSDEADFCFKLEYDWFRSLFNGEPAGHYIGKGCAKSSENQCPESGYYWYSFTWITCCKGDGCNK